MIRRRNIKTRSPIGRPSSRIPSRTRPRNPLNQLKVQVNKMLLSPHRAWMLILLISTLWAVMLIPLARSSHHLASFFLQMFYQIRKLWRRMRFRLMHWVTRILLKFLP